MANNENNKGFIYRVILFTQSELFAKILLFIAIVSILFVPFCSYRMAVRSNLNLDEAETKEERIIENKRALRKAMSKYLDELGKEIKKL